MVLWQWVFNTPAVCILLCWKSITQTPPPLTLEPSGLALEKAASVVTFTCK